MEIKTAADGNARVHYLLGKVIKSLNLNHPPEIKRILENSSDDSVELDGWIIITAFKTEEKRPTIADRRKRYQAIHYEVSVVKTIHGVRYYKDGSGQPDDVDIIPVHDDLSSPSKAVEEAIILWMKNHMEAVIENIQEEEFAKDEHKFWEEEAKRQKEEKCLTLP